MSSVFPDVDGSGSSAVSMGKASGRGRAAVDRTKPLLEVVDLDVVFRSNEGDVHAVQKASLTVYPGQTVAIVGESGSGKSTTALAVIGLLPGNGRVAGGEIRFEGKDISTANKKEIVRLRGDSIGLVPQDPMTNLNPVWRVQSQIVEALSANGLGRGKAAKVRAANSSRRPACPTPRSGCASSRTSSPAACGSGR